MTKLSIIIPAKNEEQTLPKLVESIHKQTFTDLEIIVADANSTDNTSKKAKALGCYVVKGGTPDISRNNGAAASKSEILVFIDADAVLPSEYFLEQALDEFKSRNLDVAGTTQTPIKTGKRLNDFMYKAFYEFANIAMRISQYTKNPAMQNCMFAKKQVHEAISGFRPLEFGEDAKYAKDAVEKGYKFRILKTPEKVFVSPRRFESRGIFKMLKTYIYFNTGRIFGHEFYRGKSKKYFD